MLTCAFVIRQILILTRSRRRPCVNNSHSVHFHSDNNIPREAIKSKHNRSATNEQYRWSPYAGNGTLGEMARRDRRGTGRQIGNCFEHIFAYNTIRAASTSACACRCNAPWLPVVRTEPMQKFCYAIIESSCTVWAQRRISWSTVLPRKTKIA